MYIFVEFLSCAQCQFIGVDIYTVEEIKEAIMNGQSRDTGKGAIMNGQSRDTGNGVIMNGQSRDTGNIEKQNDD